MPTEQRERGDWLNRYVAKPCMSDQILTFTSIYGL